MPQQSLVLPRKSRALLVEAGVELSVIQPPRLQLPAADPRASVPAVRCRCRLHREAATGGGRVDIRSRGGCRHFCRNARRRRVGGRPCGCRACLRAAGPQRAPASFARRPHTADGSMRQKRGMAIRHVLVRRWLHCCTDILAVDKPTLLAVLEWDGQIIATTAMHSVPEWIKRALFGNGGVHRRRCVDAAGGNALLYSPDDTHRRLFGVFRCIDGRAVLDDVAVRQIGSVLQIGSVHHDAKTRCAWHWMHRWHRHRAASRCLAHRPTQLHWNAIGDDPI